MATPLQVRVHAWGCFGLPWATDGAHVAGDVVAQVCQAGVEVRVAWVTKNYIKMKVFLKAGLRVCPHRDIR